MSKRKTIANGPSHANQAAPADRLHVALLCAVAALLVARPLMPSEAVGRLGDGAPLAMLWLAVALLTLLAAAGQGGMRARLTAVDAAVGLLIAAICTSALWAASHASPRPAVNMFWEWVAAGLVYLVVRELAASERSQRALIAVMIALAVVLAIYGYHQYFVSMPADRAAYAVDSDQVLRESGQWFEPGSSERRQFESRLASREPMATFALANSLAGYLATWLMAMLVLLAAGAMGRTRGDTSNGIPPSEKTLALRPFVTLGIAVLLAGGCLLLTKSRSACLALAVGTALLVIATGARTPAVRRLLLALGCGAAALVVAGIAFRGLDAAVLTEAGKSLGYRLEYWRSSWEMICEHPWLGCGPGNFQDAYTAYKLPQASEEIQDPHNMLVEVWATAGTPACLALLAVLATFARRTGIAMRDEAAESEAARELELRPGSTSSAGLFTRISIPLGGALGFLLAYFAGPLLGLDFSAVQAVAGVAIGAAAIYGLWPWVASGRQPALLVPLAWLVLVVNLQAAGGLTFPGVGNTFWLLLALGVNGTRGTYRAAAPAAEMAARQSAARTPWPTIAMAAFVAAGAVACYLTAYRPVLAYHAALSRTEDRAARRDFAHQQDAWLDAVVADPLAAEPWEALAQLDRQRVIEGGGSADARRDFDRDVAGLLARRPQSSGLHGAAGRWLLALYRQSGAPSDGQQAIAYLERAVELYPNSALARSELALGLVAMDRQADARRVAAEALALDDQMPHLDKRLPAETRARLEALNAK